MFFLSSICNIFHVQLCKSSILLLLSLLSYYLLHRFMSSISTCRVGIRWGVDKSIACVKTQISVTSTSSLYLVTSGNRQYLGYRISEHKSDLEDKLQTYNKINGAMRRFWKTNEQRNKIKNSQHYSQSSIEIWKWSLGTEEKRGTTFRSSTDEIFETPTWNNLASQEGLCTME